MSDYNLINDNCLEILPEIPDDSVDIIVTDPPYNINYCDWDKFRVDVIDDYFCDVLKPTGQAFIFSGWSSVCELVKTIDLSCKFTLKDWIIYDRVKGRGTKKSLVSTREDLLWLIKDDEYTFNKDKAYSTIEKKTSMGNYNGHDTRALSNVWTDISPVIPWGDEYVDHPTQKPVQIMERILKVFTNENDLVIDPYMGSGTTGVACQKLNRDFIGVELDEEYFEIAQDRIEEAKNTDWERVEGVEKWQEFDGIGEKTAETLYDELGNVEEADMDELESIDGIGSKTAKAIRND